MGDESPNLAHRTALVARYFLGRARHVGLSRLDVSLHRDAISPSVFLSPHLELASAGARISLHHAVLDHGRFSVVSYESRLWLAAI